MVSFSALFFDPEIVGGVLRDVNGHVRAALVCWGIVLSAFIVLRIPRKLLIHCLAAGAASVAVAATLADLAPVSATASTFEQSQASGLTSVPVRGPAAALRHSEHPA